MLLASSMNAFTASFSQSDAFGKLIFFALFILSLLCWTTLLYKIWIIRQVKKTSTQFLLSIEKHKGTLLNTPLESLSIKRYPEVPQPFFKIFSIFKIKTMEILEKNHYFVTTTHSNPQQGVHLSRDDLALIANHVHNMMVKQKEYLENNLFILPTVTTLAPFVGLLGTVWGILVMFSGLQTGGNFASNTAVLGGLSTALATTVLGLLIAIPSVVAYNYLRQAIKSYSSEMQDFAHVLLATVELQYRKVE